MHNTAAFEKIVQLSVVDPEGYRAEIQRLYLEEPDFLDDFVVWFQEELEKATKKRRQSSLLALVLGATDTTKR